jgi:hypothetical protein
MPLDVPNLDDRTFADLVEEAIAMLPRYAPDWTNHNPSDPGITLIELLAYFTELLIYRLNRVTREAKIQFLLLLNGYESNIQHRLSVASMNEVDAALERAVLTLRQPQRAVTSQDYEKLLVNMTASNTKTKIARSKCFGRKNLEIGDSALREADTPGHVSVVVVPASVLDQPKLNLLLEEVRKYLEPKRLLTTRLHIVKPLFLWIEIDMIIQARPDITTEDVKLNVIKRLERHFSPLPDDEPKGEGWPFGRALYLSEVYELLDKVEGVDYVKDIRVLRISAKGKPTEDSETALGIQVGILSTVGVDSRLGPAATTDQNRLLRNASGRLVGIALRSYELVKVVLRDVNVQPGVS